jgi:hypothetical protein
MSASSGVECRSKFLQLRVSGVYIRVCGDEAEVSISPIWDTIGRHEYTVTGKVSEVLGELKQLCEEVEKAVEELQRMAGEKRGESASEKKRL